MMSSSGHTVRRVSPSDLVWHYTTSPGLLGILIEHKLRATSVSFVNDPTEQQFAFDAIDAALDQLEHDAEQERASVFRSMRRYLNHGSSGMSDEFGFSARMVACSSRAVDSLGMWRAYGAQDVSGTYAIGLSADAPLGPLYEDDTTYENFIRHWTADARMFGMKDGWRQMQYTTPVGLREAAVELLAAGLREVLSEGNPSDQDLLAWHLIENTLATLEANYKHEAYEAEAEVRLETRLTSPRQFKVFPKASTAVAYTELTAAPSWGEPVRDVSRLAVREVVLWPGAPRQAIAGVRAALTAGDHLLSESMSVERSDGVRVRTSAVPFV
jgi:hypothetical protein